MKARNLRFWPAALVVGVVCCLLAAAAPAAEQPEAWSLSDWEAAWQIPPASGVARPGRVGFAYLDAPAIRAAVFPGSDQEPGLLVSRPLPLKPGAVYELSFDLLRPQFVNGHYLSANLWGHETLLDQHCITGGWQSFRVRAAFAAANQPVIVLRNDTSSRFLLRNPVLRAVRGHPAAPGRFAPPSSQHRTPFAIGVYGAPAKDWPQLRQCGFNLAMAALNPENAAQLLTEAAGLGLGLGAMIPPDAGRARDLGQRLAGLPAEARPAFFYLEDEPELRSLSPAALGAVSAALRERAPWAVVATAMVRPALVGEYAGVYDAVFMDQYPVPSQPLNWLADSMAQARGALPADRQVWAVVQAFMLPKDGWPRLPEFAEMQALAFSALAEGARGLLFYTWPQIRDNQAHRENVCRLLARLRGLADWLPLAPGPGPGLGLALAGRATTTPGGGPAVRVGHGAAGSRRLVLAINQTPYPVQARVTGLGPGPVPVRDLLAGGVKVALAGELRDTLEPLGARAWLLPPAGGADGAAPGRPGGAG